MLLASRGVKKSLVFYVVFLVFFPKHQGMEDQGISAFSGVNSVQTRCIVKGKARLRKVHFSGDFLAVFDFLRIACSPGIP